MISLRHRRAFATRASWREKVAIASVACAASMAAPAEVSAQVRLLDASANAQVRVLDAFDNVRAWTAHPSDGVSLTLRSDAGKAGRAMRMDVDFHGGSGYAIARRALPLDLPEDYEFSFWVRGDIAPNDLEFKLIDSTGDNVWWVDRRNYQFTRDWRRISIRKRHISFAWGPAGGGDMKHVASLEIVVTAGSGGRGSVWIDELAFEERPPQPTAWSPPAVTLLAIAPNGRSIIPLPAPDAPLAFDADTSTAWRSTAGVVRYTMDFGMRRELGGLIIDWSPDAYATEYDVQTTTDGRTWQSAYVVKGGNGGRDVLPMPETDASQIRLFLIKPANRNGFGIREIAFQPLAWSATPNDLAANLARGTQRGTYPRYLYGEQSYWTIAGVSGDSARVLLNTDGAVETARGSFSIEPFVLDGSRLVSWADVSSTPSLQDGDLPIPSVRWETPAVALTVTTFASGAADSSTAFVRYRVENRTRARRSLSLYLALRPFQVNPPWQFLNTPGGVSPIDSVRYTGATVTVNGKPRVVTLTTPAGFGAATFDEGDIVEFLRQQRLPSKPNARDAHGRAAGALRYDLALGPNSTQDIWIVIPLHPSSVIPAFSSNADAATAGDAALSGVVRQWRSALDRTRVELPASSADLAATLRTALAHILVNRDGAAIRPGARAYARSWIRDGSMISAALLRLGHPEEVRDFIEWYAPFQYSNGKVPCCVDRRGADPTAEHDSHGELIYLIAEYFRYTGDTALVRRMWPRVAAAAGYIDELRHERMSSQYMRDSMRVFYGLLPQSISHEGYSAKAMHSYWDDFFALKGLKDASELAGVLRRPAERARYATMADSMRANILASIALSTAQHHVDYIPGAADLGDFDATSTTVAVAPGGELARLPRPALDRTFDRYWQQLVARRDNGQGDGYTPYEWRTVGTLVRLGQKDRALGTLDFLMRDRRPPEWNQWAEVVWRDPNTPKFIGDMPHTWVGSDFLRSTLDLFAYDREEDGALVIGAGIRPEWVTTAPGLRITGLRTYEGRLDVSMTGTAREVRVTIGGAMRAPRGGIVLRSPFDAPLLRATVNGVSARLSNRSEVPIPRLPATVVLTY